MRSADSHEIVLLGAGHAHLHVLNEWRRAGRQRGRITCISDFPTAAYSGLLPAVLARQEPLAAMEIDLGALCQRGGARFVVGHVTNVDVHARRITLSGGDTISYDTLSIGVGSVPRFEGVEISADAPLVSIKPMQTLTKRLELAAARLGSVDSAMATVRVAIVGGGAGGVEVALCIRRFLEPLVEPTRRILLSLVNAGSLISGSGSGLVRRARHALHHAGIEIVERRVTAVRGEGLGFAGGDHLAADLVLWATGAAPAPMLATIALPKDAAGFLETTATLQSAADPAVFAAGDAGTQRTSSSAKAGVHAVRQGPILLENLRRMVDGRDLQPYVPQRTFMKLLNTGDERAIGEWRNLSFAGGWVWRMKMAIDRRFVDRYRAPQGARG